MVLAVAELGSDRLYQFFLYAALITGLWAVGAELMRSDRGIVAATRLTLAAMSSQRMERSESNSADDAAEAFGKVFIPGG